MLKSVSGGIALGTLTTGTIANEGPFESIVTVRGKDGVPRKTTEVPKQWWDHEQKVLEIQDNLEKQFRVNDPKVNNGIDSVAIANQSNRVSGRYISKLKVYVSSKSGLKVDIPDKVDGVPVDQAETKAHVPDSCGKEYVDVLRGGIAVDEPDNTGPGTATCMVERNGKYYIMTACHVVATTCTEPLGVSVYNYHDGGNYIGDVEDCQIGEDWAIINKASDSNISYFENEIYSQPGILAGHVTKNGLLNLKSSGTWVYHQGWATCESIGLVGEIDVPVKACDSNGITYKDNHYVKVSTPTDGGDSGGPHFHKYTKDGYDRLAIIAPHYGGESVGCAAYHIHESDNINFDPMFDEDTSP